MANLNSYDISIRKFFGENINLTDEAKKEPVIGNIISSIKDLAYSDEDILDGLYIYRKLAKDLMNDQEVQNYIKESSLDKLGNPDREFDSVETMAEAIEGLYSKMINNVYIVSAPKDKKERETYYITLLKGFRLLAEIIYKNKSSSIGLAGNLAMIADLNFVCASGWKDTLTDLITMYRDKVQERQPNKIQISSEQDLIKRRLDDVFFEASDKVIKDLSYDFIDLYNISYSLRPHYVEVFRIYANNIYGLKLPKMSLEDNFIKVGSEEFNNIVSLFSQYLKDKSVGELIVYEACKRYKEILDNDYKARYEVVDWAEIYLKREGVKKEVNGESHYLLEKNGEMQEFDDATDFLMQYVFSEDLQKVRMIAIEEIMRDKGYITKTQKINEFSDYDKSIKIQKAIVYSDAEGNLKPIEGEIQDIMQKKELDNLVIFNSIINYENYGVIADLLLQEPLHTELKNKMLIFMATKNDTKRIKVLLKKNADIDVKMGKKGNTPLMEAVIHNSKDAMEMLVNRGADINKTNNYHQSALEISAFSNKYDFAKYLLDQGANLDVDIVDYVDVYNDTHFTNILSKMSYTRDNTKLIKLFIDKGANINVHSLKDNSHVLPIVKACAQDNYDIVKLLIQNGQDINAVTTIYETRFPFEREEWLKVAYKNYKRYKKDKSIQKVLHEMRKLKKACSKNDLEKVKEILNFNSCVGYRRVALRMLINVDKSEKFLEREELKKRILDELEGFDSENYLEWAINTKDKKVVDLLIKNKKISLQDLDDKNPKNLVKLAQYTNNEDIVDMLKAHKSLLLQLENNILKSRNKSSSSLTMDIK